MRSRDCRRETSTGSSIAYALERRLFDLGRAAYVLDGQNLRRGISRDLGFSSEERSENLRRGAEVAHVLNEAGMICIAAFLAPREEIRAKAREVVGEDRFLTIHLTAPDDVIRARDADGMYARADAGEIANFPGVSAPYEPPPAPDLVHETDQKTVPECVEAIVDLLASREVIDD